jgi:subtilisin family serine protease
MAIPGHVAVLVELEEPPAARVYGNSLRGAQEPGGSTRTSRTAAATAARAQVGRNEATQAALAPILATRFGATEIYRVTKALNAMAVLVDLSAIPEMAKLPGVLSVRILRPEHPSNASSVPFIGAPPIWNGSAGAGVSLTGAGVRIGIIDTGLDYIHSDFGGTGLLADYQANDPTAATTPFYPSAKVAGGVDLAGDAYNGYNTPVPYANPMDCYGHGTHVAGTAAGFGVNSDGTTYRGAYGPATPALPPRISR